MSREMNYVVSIWAFFCNRFDCDDGFVVIEVDRVDKGADQHLPMLQFGRVEMLETLEPESNEVLGHPGLGHLLQGNLLLQLVPYGLQLLQSLLRRFR